MIWISRKIDEWRRGPALRAAQEVIVTIYAQQKPIELKYEAVCRDCGVAREELRLLHEFLGNGHVKIRCRAPGCNAVSWKWETRLVEQRGRRFIVAICEDCVRRQHRAVSNKEDSGAAEPEPLAVG